MAKEKRLRVVLAMGTIVQVGSTLAYRAIPLQSGYCGCRHAFQGFTLSVRSELLHGGSDVWITIVQLPALNTPPFSWVKTRLPRHPLPVPPVYQPEVAARAVCWAAHHRQRELWVAAITATVLLGIAIFPEIGDRYRAMTGYNSQQTDEPVPPDRPYNRWEPLPGDWGARNVFDDRARSRSLQLRATTYRGAAALCALALLSRRSG